MATAKITLTNGMSVTVEGNPDEIHRIIRMYEGGVAGPKATAVSDRDASEPLGPEGADAVDLIPLLVNQIKSSEFAEAIEEKILDQRSQLNRILLPMFFIHTELGNKYGLTSGDIAKVTRELGVPVGQPDVSKILAGEASRYVLGDSARVRGKPVRYKLSRRGVQLLAGILGDRSAH